MIMSENDKDIYIRDALSKDKAMLNEEDVRNKIKREIDVSVIKLKRYTYTERRLMLLLVVLLTISILSNVYLFINRNQQEQTAQAKINTDQSLSLVKDMDSIIEKTVNNDEFKVDVVRENKPEEEPVQVTPVPVGNTIDEENTVSNSNVLEPKETTDELDEELLQEELTRYALYIGRNGEDASELEKNTILLLIANSYFNTKSTASKSLEISSNSQYAMTADNVHKYIKELTGINVETYLESYVNYMKYNDKSKFYSSGAQSTDITDEKYEISNLRVSKNSDTEFEVVGDINRKSVMEIVEKNKQVREEDVEANYSFKAIVEVNEEYTYTPYLIKEFEATLKPGEFDNVERLVDLVEDEKNN